MQIQSEKKENKMQSAGGNKMLAHSYSEVQPTKWHSTVEQCSAVIKHFKTLKLHPTGQITITLPPLFLTERR